MAVEPNGLDPCDLRVQHGDEAVRQLVATRVPLFEFAIKSALADVNLNTAEGRVTGLREAAPVVARIRDTALRPEYTRMLAGWLGMEVEPVRAAVGQAVARPSRPEAQRTTSTALRSTESTQPGDSETVNTTPSATPDPRSLQHHVEREALKAVLQLPAAVGTWFDTLEPGAFSFAPYSLAQGAVMAAGGATAGAALGERGWIDAVLSACPDDAVRGLVTSLVVEPLRTDDAEAGEAQERYAVGIVARLLEFDAARRVADVKGRLQRVDAASDPNEYERLTRDLFALEAYRRDLRTRAMGDE